MPGSLALGTDGDDEAQIGELRGVQIAGRRGREFRRQLAQHADIVAGLEARRGDERDAARFVERVFEFGQAIGRVDVDEDQAGLGGGELGDDPFGVVRRPDADPLAGLEAERDEAGGEGIDLALQLAVIPAYVWWRTISASRSGKRSTMRSKCTPIVSPISGMIAGAVDIARLRHGRFLLRQPYKRFRTLRLWGLAKATRLGLCRQGSTACEEGVDMEQRHHLRGLTRRRALTLAGGLGLAPFAAGFAAAQVATPIMTRPIPSSGERLPVVGLGTDEYYSGAQGQSEALAAVVRTLVEGGGSVVDTSSDYGASETMIGAVLTEGALRPRIFLATKLEKQALRPAELQGSLKRLGVNKIDLMQVHNVTSDGQSLAPLRDWKAQGLVRYIGITTDVTAFDAISKR
jgi:hypothetical protein